MLLFLATLAAATAAEPKRVMMLHSFGPDVKPWSDYARAIRTELSRQSPWPLDLHEHSLVTARFSDENPEVPFVEYLRALFAKHRLDLIVSIGAPAAGFVQRHRQQLFSTIPMVLTVVDQRRVQYSVLTANDAVVAVAINYLRAFENILRVLPDTKTVAVVVGNSPIEKYWKEEIGNEVKPFANRIAFTWYNDLSFEDILKHAAALPPQSAIFWELMVVDAAGVPHEEGRALTRLHAVANAPIFSYTDAFFGREIVGGPHVPVLEVGRQTAEVAIRILRRREGGRHQSTAHRIWNAEVRLEGNAALGHQREPSAAGKRDPLSRSDRMGAISRADSRGQCCDSAAGRVDRLAALRAAATPPLGSRSARAERAADQRAGGGALTPCARAARRRDATPGLAGDRRRSRRAQFVGLCRRHRDADDARRLGSIERGRACPLVSAPSLDPRRPRLDRSVEIRVRALLADLFDSAGGERAATFPRGCRATWRSASFASRRRGCATSHAMPERAGQRFACGAWTAGCNSLSGTMAPASILRSIAPG